MNRNDLLRALKAVIPGVSKGEALLIGADSFIFRRGLIQSYNDVLSVTFPLDVGIEATVKAAELVKVLEKMSGADIKLEVNDKSLEISDGVTTLSMRLIEAGTMALLESLALEDLEWLPLPKDFVKALTLCLPSVSRNVVHGALTGIRIENDCLLSTDNFRATWVELETPMSPSGFPFSGITLPGDAAIDLLKLQNLEQFSFTDAWAHFLSSEGAVFSSRLIASDFPAEPLKQMFPEPGHGSYQLPDGLEKTLERVRVLAYTQDDGSDYVTMSEDKGNLKIKGERQFGSIKEKIKLKAGEWPDGVIINIQPGHLLDIMSKTRDFQMVDKLAYFHGPRFKHIISTIIKD